MDKTNDELEIAKKRCESIIELRPDYAEAYNNLAILYDRKNDYDNALKNYAKAVNLQPNYAAAHYNLGLLFLKYGRLDEAIIQFKNVIELNPFSFSAHYYLGNGYLVNEQLDLAQSEYTEALSLKADHSDTLNNLGVIALKKKEPQLAIDYFTKALAFDIHHEDAKNNLAATFMQYDRYENAIRHYQELLTEHYDNLEYHYNIGVAYMHLGHLDKAIHHFQYALTLDPHHVAALNNLGMVYWRQDKKTEAKYLLSKALEMDPHNQNSRYLLSAANEQEEYTQAPAEYIKNLFDNYAVQYDEHLCQTLHYILPEKIGELLDKNLSSKKETVLDLGCGTGLLAPYLKPHFEELWGVDLSQKMLDNAEKTGFYTQLICEDIQTFFNQTNQLYSSAKSIFDAIIAAEVFEYFGDLSDLFSVIKSHLKPNGLFIFSIELSEKNKDFTLQETARFAHRADYIHRLAEKNHLTILQEISLSARLQNDKPLNSSLFIMSGN